MNTLKYHPNTIHDILALWEEIGILDCVITQNIDGFHQEAGSRNVIELHGSINHNYYVHCKKLIDYSADFIFNHTEGIPKCLVCGNIIRPDIVLYEEKLNEDNIYEAEQRIKNCKTLIVGGTSLTVYPARNLVNDFKGENLIIINNQETEFDKKATLVINDDLKKVLTLVYDNYINCLTR